MSKLSIRLIFFYLVLLVVSCKYNPPERNRLVFKDNIKTVIDSINLMTLLIKKVPDNPNGQNKFYEIKDKKLTINDLIVNEPTNCLFFTKKEKESFINLSLFLYKNGISAGYFDKQDRLWRFIYKESPEDTFDDRRYVYVLHPNEISRAKLSDTILDLQDSLFLSMPKDAKMR